MTAILSISLVWTMKWSILGIIQFVTTKHGTFITWLAVLHEPPPHVYFSNDKTAISSFRQLGMASFLQELVQLSLIARGWKTDLYLQSNIQSSARNYYEKRGHKRALANLLSSIPGLHPMPFKTEPSISLPVKCNSPMVFTQANN